MRLAFPAKAAIKRAGDVGPSMLGLWAPSVCCTPVRWVPPSVPRCANAVAPAISRTIGAAAELYRRLAPAKELKDDPPLDEVLKLVRAARGANPRNLLG